MILGDRTETQPRALEHRTSNTPRTRPFCEPVSSIRITICGLGVFGACARHPEKSIFYKTSICGTLQHFVQTWVSPGHQVRFRTRERTATPSQEDFSIGNPTPHQPGRPPRLLARNLLKFSTAREAKLFFCPQPQSCFGGDSATRRSWERDRSQ